MKAGNFDYRDTGLKFPKDFIFGAATAAYQIEGAVADDGRGSSIWDVFSHIPGTVANGDTGDIAADHYHRLDEDLDLMARLNLQSYRFSIAWSRIQPYGIGPANQLGLDFYNRLVDGLLTRGITPTVTLYHWDLPTALEEKGGWPNRATAYAFAEYASILGLALGDRVSMWTTLNEPRCSAYLGYGSGVHAPGRKSPIDALKAVHHLNLAHGLGLTALREVVAKADAKYSVTLDVHALSPEGPTGAEAVRRIDALAHRAFTGPMLEGAYPQDLLEDTSHITDWPFVLPGDEELIHQPIDLLGLNYYATKRVRLSDSTPRTENFGTRTKTAGSKWPGSEHVEFLTQPGPHTAMGWNISPEGLERVLTSLSDRFPTIPLVITENGAAFKDELIDGAVHDAERVDYLHRHVVAAHRALQRGVDLRGYFVWSLFDNYEWAFGYAKRFGIVHIDYRTMARTPKDSALWFAELASANTIPE